MKILLALLVPVIISGCSTVSTMLHSNAGKSHNTYESKVIAPVVLPDGKVAVDSRGRPVMSKEEKKITLYDTKDGESTSLDFGRADGELTVKVKKKGIDASAPMQAIVEAIQLQSVQMQNMLNMLLLRQGNTSLPTPEPNR